ncbi:MAG: PEGA domain-containing protein [Candidatus Daviesbacteria bacterium]|nr:PEGA domain-containing protein [Candidatus Daviesbacteria bacterium]
MNKRFILTAIMVVLIGIGVAVAVLAVKGYTFSPSEGRVVGTGIISVTSIPDGGSVFIDGHLTTATNTTISQLKPKVYTVKITKEGFIPWEKSIEVSEGLVSEVKATLFPAIPTIYPLTFNGVVSPVLSSDGENLAFGVPTNPESPTRQRGGIWVWTMSSQPIAFNRGAQPHQIVTSDTTLDFSKANFRWSPDSTQILVTLQEDNKEGASFERNYLLPINQNTSLRDLRDITPNVESVLKGWEEEKKSKDEARILTIKDINIRQIASSSAEIQLLNGVKHQDLILSLNGVKRQDLILWSPDETKILVGKKKEPGIKEMDTKRITASASGRYVELTEVKVYDLETGENYPIPPAKYYFWLPDSLHLILIHDERIAITEFDGTNEAVIYAGKFDNGYVFPWPDSSRLAIVSSFNTPTASKPNLFGINLK